MRGVVLCLMVSTLVAWSWGCAETSVSCPPGQLLVDGECLPPLEPCEGEVTKQIQMFCWVNGPDPSLPTSVLMSWELTVEPTPIPANETFGARLSAKVLVDESLLNAGLTLNERFDFSRVTFNKAEARIRVRRGAKVAEDVLIRASLPPGGEERTFDTSDECYENGQCGLLGRIGPGSPCALHEFCATAGFDLPLGTAEHLFDAEGSGSVLFGFAEPDDGPIEVGLNREAFAFEARDLGKPIEYSGLDVSILGLPLNFECVMAANSRGPDGVSTPEVGASPIPDGALIACPIQEPREAE